MLVHDGGGLTEPSLTCCRNTLHLLNSPLSVILYLTYMGILVWGIYLAMGTIGFLCSLWFTCGLYSLLLCI